MTLTRKSTFLNFFLKPIICSWNQSTLGQEAKYMYIEGQGEKAKEDNEVPTAVFLKKIQSSSVFSVPIVSSWNQSILWETKYMYYVYRGIGEKAKKGMKIENKVHQNAAQTH